jgi:hypothetical protein
MVAAVVAVLIVAAAPAVGAAPRSADRPAGAWAAVLGPWQAVERWLRNLTGAESSDGGGGTGGGGESPGDPPQEPPPPSCPSQQNPGPCTDPGG